MGIRTIGFGILLALSGIFIFKPAHAQEQHPYCIKALSDLGASRWALLQLIGDKPMTHNEKEALRQINVVIKDISDASGNAERGDDHKKSVQGLNDAATVQQCIDLLKKAKDNISHEQEQFAGGLRDRSIKNCDEAIKFVHQATHSKVSQQ